MATSRQLLSMVQSHVAGDGMRFLSIAEQIGLEAVKAGRHRFGEAMARLVDAARKRREETRPSSVRGELGELMDVRHPEARLSDLVLDERLVKRLARIVEEQERRDELVEHALEPRRKLLFVGPPGTGKSMSAQALATELGLPLYTVRLDGVITKYLGASAAKLRLIFDAMRDMRGVYFFDEIDAIAASRGQDNDVGEARRMVNSFLQLVDADRSDCIIAAATNHASLLDRAVFRRFDAAFRYGPPDRDAARKVILANLGSFEADLDWDEALGKVDGLSQADLAAAAVDACRTAVLDNSGRLTTRELVEALGQRHQGEW